jgi:hypothetical protein
MKLTGFGPGGEFGHDVELAKQLANELAGIFALTQLLHLLEDSRERVFGLRDGAFRVVLTLSFKALVMLTKLFAEELRETLTGGTRERSRQTRGVDGRQTALQGHAAGQDSV